MRALLLVGLFMACTIPNPLFDVDTTSGQTASSTSSSGGEPTTASPTGTGETGATSLEPTVPTTGGSTGDTSDGVTGTAGTTGTTGAESSGTTSGDTTTGEAATCWAQGAGGWPLDGMQLKNFGDTTPVDPFITPDGLQLYYMAGEPHRPFLSTRAGLGDPFLNGVQQALWGNDPTIKAGHPVVVLGGTELLFMSEFNVYSATANGDAPNKFALPVPLSPPGTAAEEIKITATADSATLIVARRDGPEISEFFGGPSDRFYQYKRAQLQPGAAYAGGNDVTPMVGTLGLSICPTLSPDGLHLFFASTESETLTLENAATVVGIYYTSRPDPSMPWAPAQELAIKHIGPDIVCPSSVTADGCQLAFHRFGLGEPQTYTMYLAARAP